MNTYLILDFANLFFRARHAIKGDSYLKLGMSFHVVFSSIRRAWNDFDGTHVVVALEGRSWRKDFYPRYKSDRQVQRDSLTEKEQAEEQLFWDAFDTFKDFLIEKTNCTVLRHPQLEADDLIAGWVRHHPNDNHVILSTDTDFYQLIKENVSQYNGVNNNHITHLGTFNDKGKQVAPPSDPEWVLFEKCMRGDRTDCIFSAYPGVRTKSTRNRVGLIEAFNDRNAQGWAWNNVQLQKWTDHLGLEHRVLDDYHRNRMLIDLNAQPDHVKDMIDQTVSDGCRTKQVSQVGVHILRFCGKHDLTRLAEEIQSYAPAFQSAYP